MSNPEQTAGRKLLRSAAFVFSTALKLRSTKLWMKNVRLQPASVPSLRQSSSNGTIQLEGLSGNLDSPKNTRRPHWYVDVLAVHMSHQASISVFK